MVQIWMILLFCAAAAGSVWGAPKLSAVEKSSLLVRVYDQDAPLEWKPTDAECKRFPGWAPTEYCRRYIHPREAEPRSPVQAAVVESRPREQRRPLKPPARAIAGYERDSGELKPNSAANKAPPFQEPVREENSHPPLRKMVGQLLIAAFSGREATDPGVAQAVIEIREGKLSGVLVRYSNVENFWQLRQLLSTIAHADTEYQPLAVIEQPGGPDAVLSEDKGFTFYNAANGVTKLSNPGEARTAYNSMASELAALGVSLNIGPSGDVCSGKEGGNLSASCFGGSPSDIFPYALTFSSSHRRRRLLTALRHVPFRAGLAALPADERPSISMLHELIKNEASDALVISMKATEPISLDESAFASPSRKVTLSPAASANARPVRIVELDIGTQGTPIRCGEAVMRALQSGADMVLLRDAPALPPSITALTFEAVQAAIQSGRLPLSRIEDAYSRVQHLKAKLQQRKSGAEMAALRP